MRDFLNRLRDRPFLKYLLIALVVIVVDQIVKLIVKLNMSPGEEIVLLADFFKLHFTENPGAAAGMSLRTLFPNMAPDTAKVLLTLFSVVLMSGIVVYLWVIRWMKTALPLLIALILGGAIGNLIDRLFYGIWFAEINNYEGGFLFGRVVDMFFIDIFQGRLSESWPLFGGDYVFIWPIFNIADAAIFTSVLILLFFSGKLFPKEESQSAAEAPASASDSSDAEAAEEATQRTGNE